VELSGVYTRSGALESSQLDDELIQDLQTSKCVDISQFHLE